MLIRQALRAIGRAPALSAVVVLSLGAGIGVNTVVFSWIQARVWKPLPGVSRSGQFHFVEPRTDAGTYPGASWLEYHDLRSRLSSFEALIAFRMAPLYVGRAGEVERVFGMFVSDNYFPALGVEPQRGRFPRPEDIGGDQEPVAVISHGLWLSRFGGRADAVGGHVRVNGRDFRVLGVTAPAFQGSVLGLRFDVWIPASLVTVLNPSSTELESRSARGYTMMGRLLRSSTRERAQAELDAAMSDLAAAFPDSNRQLRGEVLRFSESPRGPQRLLTVALAILQTAMLLLLLAVCGNLTNLVLARASARQREMDIRLALGAGRGRIASLLVAETTLLAILGAALGAVVAMWGTRALLVLPLTGFPLEFDTSIDMYAVGFAMLLGLAAGVLVGAAPAIQLTRGDATLAARSSIRTATRSRFRHALMGVQVALATAVLMAAGVFIKSFLDTRGTDTGFRRDGLLLAAYDLAGRGASDSQVRQFATRVLEQVRSLPSVEAAAISTSVPLDIHGLPTRVFTLEGRVRDDGGYDQALSNVVTADYFSTMEIPLRAGAPFADLLDTATPPQAIVNEDFVRRYLNGIEPIGRPLQARGRTYTIVGVARNSLSNAFGEPPAPVIYFSYRDNPAAVGELHLRTRPGGEARLASDVRRVVRAIDPDVPVFNVRTMNAHVDTNLIFRRIPAQMFAVLGPLLLTLAAIGIYAVVAFTVSLRTPEVGIRVALGATPGRVVREFVGQSLSVITAGGAMGWVIAFIAAVNLAPDGAAGWTVLAGVPALLMAVATVACWVPARRASRVDPVAALRIL